MEIVKAGGAQALAVQIPQELAGVFDIANNMEGVIPRLPQIEILREVQMFSMSDDTKMETFQGVIIDQYPTNAWWKEKMVPGAPPKPPDCCSVNGVVPDDPDEGYEIQFENCKECERNQFRSDPEGGKGKACKNMKRLHVMMEGAMLPRRLVLPPTSITSFEIYMTELSDRGLPYACVVTNFGLTKGGDDVMKWSEIKLNTDRVLVEEELFKVADVIRKYKDAARQQEIREDEYMGTENTTDNLAQDSASDAEHQQEQTNLPVDDDIPF